MTKAEKYTALNHKYLKEADVVMEKGDYIQASEKFWGAAATIVKRCSGRERQESQITRSPVWLCEELGSRAR